MFHTTTQELQTCTFQGSGVQKHHQNSTRRPPERHRKSETVAGKGRKRAKFLGGPAEGGPVEGGSGGRWSREVQTSNNHNNQEQQRQYQNKGGPEGPARSPKEGLGFVSSGVGHNNTRQHNNNTKQQQQQKISPKHKTLKLAKVSLAKVGLPKSAMTDGAVLIQARHQGRRVGCLPP